MSKQQEKVQVKLIFEGDMLKILQNICEEECRSITQQIQYIVKNYIKEDLNKLKLTNSKGIIQANKHTTEDKIKDNTHDENFDYISDEMFNF